VRFYGLDVAVVMVLGLLRRSCRHRHLHFLRGEICGEERDEEKRQKQFPAPKGCPTDRARGAEAHPYEGSISLV
jgi:hypothetical protein